MRDAFAELKCARRGTEQRDEERPEVRAPSDPPKERLTETDAVAEPRASVPAVSCKHARSD